MLYSFLLFCYYKLINKYKIPFLVISYLKFYVRTMHERNATSGCKKNSGHLPAVTIFIAVRFIFFFEVWFTTLFISYLMG